MQKQWQLLILLIFSLLPNVAFADNLSYYTMPNTPYQVRYTGVMGLLFDEYESFIVRQWNREINLRYGGFELLRVQQETANIFSDARDGKWWERPWWLSLQTAPRTIIVTYGPTRDIINLCFVRITSNLKFRTEDIEVETQHWDFKISPSFSFSSRAPFLNEVSIRVRCFYRHYRKRLFNIDILMGYNFKDEEAWGEIIFSLVEW